jgi:hypothetical protein
MGVSLIVSFPLFISHQTHSKALGRFASFKEALDFTAEYHLDAARLHLLIDAGRFVEAAELLVLWDRLLEAIQVFLKQPDDKYSRGRAIQCILQGLWRRISFRITPKPLGSNPDVDQLLEAAAQLPITCWSSNDRDEVRRNISGSALHCLTIVFEVIDVSSYPIWNGCTISATR